MRQKHRVIATEDDITIEEMRYQQRKQKENIRRSQARREVDITMPPGTEAWIQRVDSNRINKKYEGKNK